MGMNRINNARHTSGNNGSRIIYPISHGIAGTDFNRNLIFLHELHQFETEGNHIAVNIRPGDILQMASGADSFLQAFPDHTQIMLHGLTSGHFQLHEDMIIGTAYQNTCFFHANFLNQLEILFAGTDPTGHFRELVASFHTFIDRIPVLFAVKEKLTGPYHSIRAPKPVHIIINIHNLFRGIGSAGLLAVAEGSIGNPDILRHIVRHNSVIKRNLRNLRIRKHISENIGFLDVIQYVHMLFYFQKIVFVIHAYRTV